MERMPVPPWLSAKVFNQKRRADRDTSRTGLPGNLFMKKIQLLLCRAHPGDPLTGAIKDITRTNYSHAMLLKNPDTNTVSEAFFPHVRERFLDNSEIHGIDVFDISTTYPNFTPLTEVQVQNVLDACAAAEKTHEDYNIIGMLAFLPGVDLLIKQAQDDGKTSPVFCSQYCADKISVGSGLNLLNADSKLLAPGYLAWSPLLFPAPPLKLIAAEVTPSFTSALKDAMAAVNELKPVSSNGT